MDKQIEEITKELCPHYYKGECYYETNEVSDCNCECEFDWAVKKLLNAGYRKIPENAVVLTKEEYEKLGLFVETVQEYETVNGQLLLVKERKAVKKLPTDIVEFVRKETAEKFAERLKEELENRSLIEGYDLEDLEFDGETIQECIDKICKEITDKVVQNEN